jgi:hypothetical protein
MVNKRLILNSRIKVVRRSRAPEGSRGFFA